MANTDQGEASKSINNHKRRSPELQAMLAFKYRLLPEQRTNPFYEAIYARTPNIELLMATMIHIESRTP